jgi:DNA-directed RNA polymerase subunit omega
MDLIQGFDSNYRFVLVAAKRARQLLSGARPQVESATRKPCKLAQEEILAGKVKWEMSEYQPKADPVGEELDHTLITPDLG